MEAVYTAAQYVSVPLTLGLGGMLLIMLLSILVGCMIARRCKNPALPFAFLLIPILCGVLLLNWVLPVIERTGDLLIPGEYTVHTAAGRIESVTPANTGRFHLRDGKFLGGAVLSVDGISCYVMDESLLKAGMVVAIDYAHSEHNVILRWREVTPQQADQILSEQPAVLPEQPGEENTPPPSSQMVKLGTWLLRIGFAGFVGIIVLLQLFGEKLALYLFRRGAKVQGQIQPDLRGVLLHTLPPLACLSTAVIGGVVGGGGKGMLLVLMLGLFGFVCIIALDATTYLKVDGQAIKIRYMGKTRTYTMEDVCRVYWRNHKGITGKSMVLVLNDGKTYWFSMDAFLGVQSVFDLIYENTDRSCASECLMKERS